MSQHPIKSVFVADDDEDDRFLLRIAFDKCCPETKVSFAVDGLDLLQSLDESALQPCLIILDLNMPRLDGFESLKILRASQAYQQVPIVVFSTSAETGDLQKAKQLGANDYIVKPLTINRLDQMAGRLKKDWDLADCQ
ncbi:response regulator [Spirosoma sp.]|uniref:response regulator n=1 Tax=Spirosoma sp. TaxID=1899569 RepID=UPI002615EBB1|nr:response regulator [Spirosoma sp.]MCX6212890.1 response regulator [Spirosoma sp.]